MGGGHDLPSGSPAPASGAGGEPDALSHVLRGVRLSGALFFLVDATTPWAIEVPEAARFASLLVPRAQQLVSYHVVTEGRCWAGLEGQPAVPLEAGDIVLFPHGDAYQMSDTPGREPGMSTEQALGFFREMAAGRLPAVVREGGGREPGLRLVCGFLSADVRPFNPVLAALPRLVHIPHPRPPQPDRLAPLVEFALAESAERRSGGQCVLLGLSELLFVEVIRRHLLALPPGQAGWLGGLRDPVVGRALGLLHARPERAWTLEALAHEAGASRSTLAERFAHFAGQPPMQYLARWRMQMAARKLADGSSKVSAVALEVGYESEAAFSRAFKKLVGMPPAEWRRRAAAGLPADSVERDAPGPASPG